MFGTIINLKVKPVAFQCIYHVNKAWEEYLAQSAEEMRK